MVCGIWLSVPEYILVAAGFWILSLISYFFLASDIAKTSNVTENVVLLFYSILSLCSRTRFILIFWISYPRISSHNIFVGIFFLQDGILSPPDGEEEAVLKLSDDSFSDDPQVSSPLRLHSFDSDFIRDSERGSIKFVLLFSPPCYSPFLFSWVSFLLSQGSSRDSCSTVSKLFPFFPRYLIHWTVIHSESILAMVHKSVQSVDHRIESGKFSVHNQDIGFDI